jgi:tetratricopeptide (TPR) repeat protein
MTTDICPELYINEAEIIINSINIFDYICCRRSEKYINIANLYKNAGNLYKMKDLKLSYDSYEKSLHYFSKIPYNNQKNIADCYINCALTCDKQYHEKIINYYINAIDIYLLLKLNNKIPKFYENIADIYLSINDFNNAILYYEKVCEKNDVIDNYDSILKKEEIYNKIGVIYIVNMNDYEKGLEAYKKYESLYNKNNVPDNFCNNYVNYKKYFIIIVLLFLLKENYVKSLILLDYYESICKYLKNDYDILKKLIINIQSYNIEKYEIENNIKKKETLIISLSNEIISKYNNILIKTILNKIVYEAYDKNL